MKIELTDTQIVRMANAINALSQIACLKAASPSGLVLAEGRDNIMRHLINYDVSSAKYDHITKDAIAVYRAACEEASRVALESIRAGLRRIADGIE